MSHQEFSEELQKIRDYIDAKGLSFHPECGTGIKKLDKIAQQMLDYIEQKEEEYTFSEKSTKEIVLNWYSKELNDIGYQDLLGAETLPNSITEKKLKEIGLIFGEDGAEITTKEQVEYLSQFLETKIDLDEYDYALNRFYVYRGGKQ